MQFLSASNAGYAVFIIDACTASSFLRVRLTAYCPSGWSGKEILSSLLSCCKYSLKAFLPVSVSRYQVTGFRFIKVFLMLIYPASSSFLQWLARLPSVAPIFSLIQVNSASSQLASKETTASLIRECSRSSIFW